MSTGKPTLHHLNNSQSQSILWLLEELGIDYDLVPYKRVKGRAPPELKQVHPRGKSPVLVTAAGRVITERSAISLYLIRTYDRAGRFQVSRPVLPSPIGGGSEDDGDEEDGLVREEELVSLGAATLNPVIMLAFILGFMVKMSPFFVWPLTAGFNLMLRKAFIDAELAGGFGEVERALLRPKKTNTSKATTTEGQPQQQHAREYLMGGPDPTRADFVVQWFVEWAMAGKMIDLQQYPATKAWYDRCQARPAYRRALEKGNGYDLNIGSS